MPTVYVIHAKEDEPLVKTRLLRPLPALGFDQWVSAQILDRRDDDRPSIASGMDMSAAILAVVSHAAIKSPRVAEEVAIAIASGRPLIPIRVDDTVPADLPAAMTSLPAVAIDGAPETFWRALAELLPAPTESTLEYTVPPVAERIGWNEQVFSHFLGEAVSRHDYNRGNALIDAFDRHLAHRPDAYGATEANTDLSALRKKRQFTLMRRYASGVLASGTSDFTVRRQYAQSLIEHGEFAPAIAVLDGVIGEADRKHPESIEARGLLGRTYKQQYVDAPKAPDAPRLMQRAIDAYESVFREDETNLWHGINSVSLMLRASRDHVEGADPESARHRAHQILGHIQNLEGHMDVWGYATRVEALVAVQAYDEADKALTEYLAHPAMDAFEVSSTHRQFEQVLQLADDSDGRPLLDRVWQAVERYRGALPQELSSSMPMLLRVSDPEWKPIDVPDLEIHTRLDTVLSISGSTATVKELLKDPLVISVEQSRPTGTSECSRSLPFINVGDCYPAVAGPFEEKGGGALVAIVDEGIDVLHRAFLDAHGKSRIVGIWDQRRLSRERSPGVKFGTYHTRKAVAGYVARGRVPDGLGRNTDGHGTHVASIAAGRKVGGFAGGVAPDASLLIVISDSRDPIGYSQTHVAALKFIDKIATDLDLPVVVNVSQGMNAGAHDGRSLLEIAFDEFSKGGRKPGRVIVKSAGNERDKKGHAKVTLPPQSAEHLHWKRPLSSSSTERLELWWNAANEFRVRLVGPSRARSEWVGQAQPDAAGRLADDGSFRMQFVKRHVDNGDSQLTVEIGDKRAPMAAGQWTLEIESGAAPEQGDLHAWIERGVGPPSEFLNHPSEEMTLSIPGTAHNVITVGAVDAMKPIVVGGFSSYGPTRDGRFKPEVAAPGVSVQAARGGTSDAALPMAGTSMAAPHVAGAIALVLSRAAREGRPWPTATQITSALRQKTSNYSSRWDRGQGFGVIDVAALLAAF